MMQTWTKFTPLWYEAAANPHMSPITPPPRATNVQFLLNLCCKAASHTLERTSRLLYSSPSDKITL